MGERKRVVFDMDGVLLESIKEACNICGIDHNKLDRYAIKDSSLSKEEKERLTNSFYSLESFRKAEFVSASNRLNELNKICEVFVHTLCWSQEIADWKATELHKRLSKVPKENIIIDIGVNKTLIPSYIAVEDCAENLFNSKNFETGILISKPYNAHDSIEDQLSERNIVRADNLDLAIDYIEHILKEGE